MTTDATALTGRIEHALWGVTQVYDAKDGRGTEVGVHAPVYEVVAAVLPIVAEEVRKAQAEALRETADWWAANPDDGAFESDRDTRNWLRDVAAEYETGDSDEHR